MDGCVISLDQGTTSSRAVIFGSDGSILAAARRDVRQIYPQAGWVEHDPMDLLETQLLALSEAFGKSGLLPSDIAAIGITNQRETTVVWDKNTGRPIYNAIVWQCRRTAEICEKLKADGFGEYITSRTGLIPDAYFSATKIKWILDNVNGAKSGAQKGNLIFGTVDSWLIWNLTGNHVTDYSNASRTMLLDIDKLEWDKTLCAQLGVPVTMLPRPMENSTLLGKIKPGIKGLEYLAGVPVCGCAGDQQAALFGQCCFFPGQAKNTYGTGCFTLLNTGGVSMRSGSGLLTSVAWVLNGKPSYALEGSVFNGGSAIQWLRDELGIISSSHECDILAETVSDNGGVYMVPAFSGLGAPYWDMYARGTICGLTRGSTKAHIARAALEGITFQVADLISAMRDDGSEICRLRVDGGASVSEFMMQFQSDLLGVEVDRPANIETTSAGAAYLAGLYAGVWEDLPQIERIRCTDRVYTPRISREEAAAKMEIWHRAVERSAHWEKN